jgi:hypothetical protein
VFRWYDFLTFGVPAVVATGAAVGLLLSSPETDRVGEARVLVCVVATVFWFVYAMLVWSRSRFLARFTIMTKHGIMVECGGYQSTLRGIENEIDRAFAMYEAQGIAAGLLLGPKSRTITDNGYVWVTFKPGPFHVSIPGKATIMGFVRAGGNHAVVAYKHPDDTPSRTALAHELGHIVLGRHWNDWSEARHHSFQQAHGLP